MLMSNVWSLIFHLVCTNVWLVTDTASLVKVSENNRNETNHILEFVADKQAQWRKARM